MKKTILLIIFLLPITVMIMSLQSSNSQEEEKEKTETDSFPGFGDTSGGFGTGFPGFAEPESSFPTNTKNVNVWISITYIQIDKKDMDAVEKQIGFKLDPEDGKLYLSLEEKKKLMASLEKAKSFEILASGTVLTISGQQTSVKLVEEIRYPIATHVEKNEEGKGKHAEPEFLDDMSGLEFIITPSFDSEKNIISLVCFPEYRFFHGWLNFDSPFSRQPVFSLFSITSCWDMQDGLTSAVKMILPKPVQHSQALSGSIKSGNHEPKVLIMLCSVKIVDPIPQKSEEK